ncbi:hypothetical protein, partial [Streptomyces sp. NPDC003857]
MPERGFRIADDGACRGRAGAVGAPRRSRESPGSSAGSRRRCSEAFTHDDGALTRRDGTEGPERTLLDSFTDQV